MEKSYFVHYIDTEPMFSDNSQAPLGKKAYWKIIAGFEGTFCSYDTGLRITKKHSTCYLVKDKSGFTITPAETIGEALRIAIDFAKEKDL